MTAAAAAVERTPRTAGPSAKRTSGPARRTPATAPREVDEVEAAAQLDLSVPAVRRLCRAGGLDVASNPGMPLRIRLARGDTHRTLLDRLLAETGTPADRKSALALREKVACLDPPMQARYPRRLEDAGVALAVATGLGLTRANLHAVLRGTGDYLDRIIARAAAEGVPVEATRAIATPAPPPPGYRDLGVDDAAEQLGLRRNCVRRLCAVSRLETVSGECEPPLIRLAEAETRQSLLRRTLDDRPEPFDREAALRHREEVSSLGANTSVRYPKATEQAAIALLAAEGVPLDLASLRTVLCGDAFYLNRILRRLAEADAEAARRSRPNPVPPDGYHDLPAREASQQMGLSHGAVRRLCRAGEFEYAIYTGEPPRVRLPVEATRASTLARLVAEPPVPFDRAAAINHRERIACLDRMQRTRFPPDTEDMAVAILRAEGAPVDRAGLRALIWGKNSYLDRIARRANRPPDETINLSGLSASADIGRRSIAAAVALGAITERERGPRNAHCYEFASPPSRDDVSAALLALKPTGRSKAMFGQYAGLRFGLGWAALDDHPAGIMEDTADYLRSRGQEANKATMLRLIRGNPDQIAEFLVGYNERRGIDAHVTRPAARSGDGLTQRQLVERLAPELRELWGTALDKTRGSTTDLPTEADLKHLGAIVDDRIFQPAAAITLHARRVKKVPERRLHAALRAIRNLEGELGPDFGSTSVVGAVLAAWIEVPGPDASLRPKLSDTLGWKTAVALMSELLKRLPAAQRAAFMPHRLAPPAGSAGFYRQVHKMRRALSDDALDDKADRLKNLLNDPQRLLGLVLQIRDRTRALRDSVIAERDETLALGGAWPATGSLPEQFTEVATGRTVTQLAAYEVHRWSDIYDALVAAGALGADELPGPSGLAVPADRAHLFEHNHVVAAYRCVASGASDAAPLAFARQFEAGMFHPLLQTDGAETDAMMAMMAEQGLMMGDRSAPSGLWAFEGPGRRRMALLAQRHLGLTLLPIIEVDHGQQYATLAMSTNFDWPTRPAELLQNRLDDKKWRIFREEGIPGPILAYKAIRKFGMHFGAGEDDFYMFEGSIGLQRELLATTTARLFPAGIPSLPAAKGLHAKGITEGHFTYSARKGPMQPQGLGTIVNLMLAGTARVKLRDGKELWTALSRRAGLALDLRRRASRHVDPGTTRGYGAETALEVENLQHELAKARALAGSTSLRVVQRAASANAAKAHDDSDLADAEDEVAALCEARGLDGCAARHRAEAARIRAGGAARGSPS